MKPFSPSDVLKHQEDNVPDMVIQAVNNLLLKEYKGHSAVIAQEQVVNAIIDIAQPPVSRQLIFASHWLNFENAYRKMGWNVVFDKPAYNESYEASWRFTKTA